MMSIFNIEVNIKSSVLALTFLFALTPLCSYANGGYISEECHALTRSTINHLRSSDYCTNDIDCFDKFHFYFEESTKIYLNLYSQNNNEIISRIVSFFLTEGLRITKGKAVSLGVFRGPHSDYEGLSNAFFIRRHAAIELELSQ